MISKKLQASLNQIPGFKQWSENDINGIKEFMDIKGVALGGLATFLKENYKKNLDIVDVTENMAVECINDLVVNATPELRDLILTEFFESLVEEEPLFERVISLSGREVNNLVSGLYHDGNQSNNFKKPGVIE